MHVELDGAKPLQLGVTGHRVLAESGRLRSAVRDALALLNCQYPGQPLVIYSALAEGADRLVVEEALSHNASFVAVLPLPVDDYCRDFASPASRDEFNRLLELAVERIRMPGSNTRNEAYWKAGKYVVDRSDVLLALWDGQPGQGISGTAEVVTYARSLGRPLLWIRTGNRVPGTNVPSTLADQGTLTLENFAPNQRAATVPEASRTKEEGSGT